MSEFICAFSSHSRELYRSGIYKVLSMPKDSIIHFRYKTKWVEEDIWKAPQKYIDKDVIIFYTPKNQPANRPDNISVRKAKLIIAEVSKETELFHAYIQLGDFCEATIEANFPDDKLPDNKFFSNIPFEKKPVMKEWHDIINKIKQHFPAISFYNIKSIKTSLGRRKKPIVRCDKKSTYYKLNHGNKYFAELSLANPDNVNCKINFSSSSEDISANIPNPIEITAQFDDIVIPIYLKTLNVSTESSFISFMPKNENTINSEYALNIEIKKRIGFYRPFLFGIYSGLAALSLWVINKNSDSLANIGNWGWAIDWKVVIAGIGLILSSALLFSQFNKK